jgi:dihydrolipoamide dehydrogenase
MQQEANANGGQCVMAKRVVVIGAGPGGYAAAIRAAQLGAEVTVIEQDQVGGTCLNWGCIPSKVMITTAELLDKFHRAHEFGLRLEGKVFPDMQRLMARKEKVIQDQAKGILDLFQHHRIHYVSGKGSIEKPGLATALLGDGKILEVPWDKLIVAPGTRPRDFPEFPFDGQQILSSNDALCLQEVPASIMVLGGGVIGCEFAFLLTALGAQVTVVEASDRLLPLPSVDEDCSKVIQREMKKRKIRFILKRTAERVERHGGKLRVTLGPSPILPDPREMAPSALEVDKLLVTIGRQPNTGSLGLEKLGLSLDVNGWMVANERMETCAPGVYAIGDVLGPSKIMLAHVASMEGLVAAENAVSGDRTMDYCTVPSTIFTMPEVANVGMSEMQAREGGLNVHAATVLFRALGKSQVIGEIAGEAKIVFDAETGSVLGVHIVGPHATELIAEGSLAVKMGLTVKDLAETIHAHPTLAEVMRETSLKALDSSLHG